MKKPNDEYSPAIQEVARAIDQKHVEHIKRQRTIIDELRSQNPVPYWLAVAIAFVTIVHMLVQIIDTVIKWF